MDFSLVSRPVLALIIDRIEISDQILTLELSFRRENRQEQPRKDAEVDRPVRIHFGSEGEVTRMPELLARSKKQFFLIIDTVDNGTKMHQKTTIK